MSRGTALYLYGMILGIRAGICRQSTEDWLQVRGAQWLSGRVFDSRPRGCEFEPLHRHCFVVLEQDSFILA